MTFGELPNYDEALSIRLKDTYGLEDSPYDDAPLSKFLEDVFGEDYDDISINDINDALEERDLETIDFEGMAFDDVKDMLYPNASDEEFEEEMMDRL